MNLFRRFILEKRVLKFITFWFQVFDYSFLYLTAQLYELNDTKKTMCEKRICKWMVMSKLCIYVYRFESEVKAIRLKMDSISGKKEGGKRRKKCILKKKCICDWWRAWSWQTLSNNKERRTAFWSFQFKKKNYVLRGINNKKQYIHKMLKVEHFCVLSSISCVVHFDRSSLLMKKKNIFNTYFLYF